MVNLVNTYELMKVVEAIEAPQNFITELLFPFGGTFDSQKLLVEYDTNRKDGILPVTRPENNAKLIRRGKSSYREITPAYIKFKDPINHAEVNQRMPREQIGGSMSPQDRENAIIVQMAVEHQILRQNTIEKIACDLVLTGQTASLDSDYAPNGTYDFGRDASLDVVLSGEDLWVKSDGSYGSDSDPIKNVQVANQAVADVSGASPDLLILGNRLVAPFLDHAKTNDLISLEKANGAATFDMSPMALLGATYHGRFANGQEVWSYSKQYSPYSETGTTTTRARYWDENKFAVLSVADFQGDVRYGTIQDKNFREPAILFSRMIDSDTEGTQQAMLSQSAPLVTPGLINAVAVFAAGVNP